MRIDVKKGVGTVVLTVAEKKLLDNANGLLNQIRKHTEGPLAEQASQANVSITACLALLTPSEPAK